MKKSKTRAQLAEELGMSYITLYRKLKAVGYSSPRGLLSAEQQQHIRELLGFPETRIEEPNELKVKDFDRK